MLNLDARTAELVQLAVRTDVKVLLTGETGTGKSTLARAIHDRSGLPGNFVQIDCASIPDTLIESELFGTSVGAYTGATRARMGRIEMAAHGTLFLDEVDSMPMAMQAKLLTAIHEKGVIRLGENQFRPTPFRLISAVQRPLDTLVPAGLFRGDLYHRLSVLEIHMPPLRESRSAIPEQFARMVQAECARTGASRLPIPPAVDMQLILHDWPGNYRELMAAAERFALGIAPLRQPPPLDTSGSLRKKLAAVEHYLLSEALNVSKGLLGPASHALGLPVETLRYKLRIYGIKPREGPDRE